MLTLSGMPGIVFTFGASVADELIGATATSFGFFPLEEARRKPWGSLE